MKDQDFYGPLLGHCAHLAKERMRGPMTGYGMTPAQTSVLLYLHENGCTSQSALAERMRVKAPTANGILERMEEKGLLCRTVDAKDARRRIVALTDKGRGLVAELERCFQEAEADIVRGFSREEKEQLKVLLRRVMANLEEEYKV
ncbi:MAG: MarR family transcriptional regulator [Oscillospiraceae bacterium]|nr:MarR family transcriptional regulator [Oscillospiraceae bacterium]